MKLIILGSGTCVPSLKRSAPAYYLEAGGRQILIDCGCGTLLQLEKALIQTTSLVLSLLFMHCQQHLFSPGKRTFFSLDLRDLKVFMKNVSVLL
jgi:ribonuclease BN (tRNA processing enzyme)